MSQPPANAAGTNLSGPPAKARLTPLLSNETLARVERLRLVASRRFTDRHRGEHLRGKGGSSNEFSDFRDYTEGDDVRFVDWNIFARLRRPYVKLYAHEEEMTLAILVDLSRSMDFQGKADLARSLAAALGVVGLYGQERVCAYAWRGIDEALPSMDPSRGRTARGKLLRFVESVQPLEPTDKRSQGGIERGVEAMLRKHRGRGVCLILSDFLTQGELPRMFNRLFSTGLEPLALQILAPSELDPELAGDLRLVDCEDQRTLDVTAAGDVVALYHEYLSLLTQTIDGLCRQRGGNYLRVASDEPAERVLFERMRRSGWLK